MTTILKHSLCFLCFLLAIAVATNAAYAQSTAKNGGRNSGQSQYDESSQNGSADTSQTDQNAQGSRQESQTSVDQDSQNDRRASFNREPAGWVTIATDYDNDGRFDDLETIYVYDLERARENSRNRADSTGPPPTFHEFEGPSETIRGEIQSLQSEDVAGSPEQFLVAQLQSNNGQTEQVCLGPKSESDQLNLKEGDQVSVTGHWGRINNKSVFIANEVKADGKQVDIDRSSAESSQTQVSSDNTQRIRGKILSTRTAHFRNIEKPQVLARVKLADGRTSLVNLGPASTISQLDLQDSDQLVLTARTARINGEDALVAEHIQANGQSIDVPRPEYAHQNQNSTSSNQSSAEHTQQRDTSQTQTSRQSTSHESDVTYDGSERAALGVTLGEGPDHHIQIRHVLSGSPADRSHLQVDDEILAIDGKKVNSYGEVVQALRKFHPQEHVNIKVLRDGDTYTANVKLASREKVLDSQQ